MLASGAGGLEMGGEADGDVADGGRRAGGVRPGLAGQAVLDDGATAFLVADLGELGVAGDG